MTWAPYSGPLEFELGGDIWTIDPPAGPDLVQLAATGNWWGIVPGLLEPAARREAYVRLEDDDDELDLPDLYAAATQVAETWLGHPWHVAVRLAAAAAHRWTLFDGWCITSGFDPTSEHTDAHRIINAVHAWIRSGCTEDKEWRRIEQQLYAPPPGQAGGDADAAPPWAAEEEAALFQQAMGALGAR